MTIEEATAREMAARLQRLEDYQAICQTLDNYCQGLDRRDEALYADQFEEDAVLMLDDCSWVGQAAIRDLVVERCWPQLQASTHVNANVMITFAEPEGPDGTTAALVKSDCLALVSSRDGQVELLTMVHHDRLSKRTGRWRFTERRILSSGKHILHHQ